MLTIKSAISVGESLEMVLFQHNITTFSVMEVLVDLRLARAHWSPPIPEFNDFNEVKYLCHNFEYLERPA